MTRAAENEQRKPILAMGLFGRATAAPKCSEDAPKLSDYRSNRAAMKFAKKAAKAA